MRAKNPLAKVLHHPIYYLLMHDDFQRHLLELAVLSGKKYTHPETGFVTLQEGDMAGCIPLYENFLYVLALLRTKTQENVLEAKKLLERLLFFQQPSAAGSFPVYLHEYPQCRDSLQSVHVLTILYWIQKEFGHVLSSTGLHEAIKKLIGAVTGLDTTPFSYWAKAKSAAVLSAFGHTATIEPLPDAFAPDPVSLAHLVQAYQLAPSLCDWTPFFKCLNATYCKNLQQYCGPAFRIFQEGFYPTVTAYDYLMGSLSQQANKPQLAALHAAYAKAVEIPIDMGRISTRYSVYRLDTCAVSLISGTATQEPPTGFFPLYLTTGTHSLVLDVPKGSVVSHDCQSNNFFVDVSFDTRAFTEEKESHALIISFSNHSGACVSVAGKNASCFMLSDPVQIRLGNTQVAFSCSVLEGSGQFVGHISRGNRKGQKLAKNRFAAFDTHLSLRAIRGSAPCLMRLCFQVN